MDDSLATVAQFRRRYEAEVARARLADAGIEAMIQADDEGGLSPGFFTVFGIRVLVTQDRLAAAQAVLAGEARGS